MKAYRYRLAPLLLMALVTILSGCPEPIDDPVGTTGRRRPTPTPLGGQVGGATPVPQDGNPAGNVTGKVPTPTPTGGATPSPSPSPTRAPIQTPVPAETNTPAPDPSPTEFNPVGENPFVTPLPEP